MKGFSHTERRISANKDQTKFRIQYKKDGKANARIVSSIEEARKVRDETDLPGAALKASANRKVAVNPKQNPNKTAAKRVEKPEISVQKFDLSQFMEPAVDKLKLLKEYMDTVNKILSM